MLIAHIFLLMYLHKDCHKFETAEYFFVLYFTIHVLTGNEVITKLLSLALFHETLRNIDQHLSKTNNE